MPILFPRVSTVEASPLESVVPEPGKTPCPVAPSGYWIIENTISSPPIPKPLSFTSWAVISTVDVTVFETPSPLILFNAAGVKALAVKVIGEPVSIPDVAVTVYSPAALPKVKLVEAWPLPTVVPETGSTACPSAPPGQEFTAKSTLIPGTGLP